MKDKIRKLSKIESKKRGLSSKKSIISGSQIIETFRNPNKRPYLPEALSDLNSTEAQEIAQAFFYTQGKFINIKTKPTLREVLQKKEGISVYIGGIVSGYSENGKRILLEFPKILRHNHDENTISENIDSHLWLNLKECVIVADLKPKTISLGDYLIAWGTPARYISKGKARYSLNEWGIIYSGLLTSKEKYEISVQEDYSRIGWIFKMHVLDIENCQAEAKIQALGKIKQDEIKLLNIFKNKVAFEKTE